jgi:hypothetical protein
MIKPRICADTHQLELQRRDSEVEQLDGGPYEEIGLERRKVNIAQLASNRPLSASLR